MKKTLEILSIIGIVLLIGISLTYFCFVMADYARYINESLIDLFRI